MHLLSRQEREINYITKKRRTRKQAEESYRGTKGNKASLKYVGATLAQRMVRMKL